MVACIGDIIIGLGGRGKNLNTCMFIARIMSAARFECDVT